jgi:Family of unknown function (DUF6263)
MRKSVVISALFLSTTILPVRFKPPVGSIYQYELANETDLKVTGFKNNIDQHAKLDMTVHYAISKEGNEFLLEMSFDKIHVYTRAGKIVTDVDAAHAPAVSDPFGHVLAALKANPIYARVRLTDFTVTFGGAMEVIGPVVDRYYTESDREQARKQWGEWVEQEMVWQNLDLLTRTYPDSARQIGDRWRLPWTNRQDINFNVDNQFRLESINAGIATIRSAGPISNSRTATWLLGDELTGDLSGKEIGVWYVNVATGMPIAVELTIHVEGKGIVGGREVLIDWRQTTKMKGKRLGGTIGPK